MSFSLGIVGLPNVGKSTLFKALTKKQIEIANYPFCTINPNIGVVEVPDERLAQLAKVSNSAKIIPTVIEFYDIAGLVKGASTGEGLGNQFLSHIREVDAIIHVVRSFSDSNITHVANRVDPEDDKTTINIELALADLATVTKRLESLHKETKSGNKEALAKTAVLQKVKIGLEAGTAVRDLALDHDERLLIRDLHLLTAKPMLYVLNVDEDQTKNVIPSQSEESPAHAGTSPGILHPVGIQDDTVIKISAKIEAELADLSSEEAKTMMSELGMNESGLDKLIKASYELLGLITFLTSGPEETRAWTIKKDTKAPQAAGVIHSDFEKNFIRAEIINWRDFVQYGEAGSRDKGLLRTEGKDYVMQDGDVCHFRHGA